MAGALGAGRVPRSLPPARNTPPDAAKPTPSVPNNPPLNRYEGITQKLKWNQRIREPPSAAREDREGHESKLDSLEEEFM